MEIVAQTDIGNVREVNQDYVLYHKKNEHECLAVLCDGMGGHNAGEIASSLACQDIIKFYQLHDEFKSEEEIQTWMSEVIYHANQFLQEKSHLDKELEGMGTTVVLAVFKDGYVYISHVGDSRAYFFDNHQLIQLTKDDTLVNALVESGSISLDEAQFHPQKNILLQAVGVSEVLKISFYKQMIGNGIILLCSDGLYNSLFDEQIIEVLDQYKTLNEKGSHLMEMANIFGGRDNIGIILMWDKGVVNNESDK